MCRELYVHVAPAGNVTEPTGRSDRTLLVCSSPTIRVDNVKRERELYELTRWCSSHRPTDWLTHSLTDWLTDSGSLRYQSTCLVIGRSRHVVEYCGRHTVVQMFVALAALCLEKQAIALQPALQQYICTLPNIVTQTNWAVKHDVHRDDSFVESQSKTAWNKKYYCFMYSFMHSQTKICWR